MLQTIRNVAVSTALAIAGLLVPRQLGAQQEAGVEMRGEVVDAATGLPVAAAQVALAGTARRALTSLQGRFAFRRVMPGTYQLEVRRLGYLPARREAIAVAHDAVVVRVLLSPAAVQLAAQTVQPGSFSFAETLGSVPQTRTRTDIETAPFGEDLFRAMSRLPGLSSGDYGAQFSIRGGRADETLVRATLSRPLARFCPR